MYLTAERLRELVTYNLETGLFTCKVARKNRRVGDVENKIAGPGYIAFCIDGSQYYAHRLAWLYVHGNWPTNEIDHINRNRTDNRLINLREASRANNQWNVPLLATNHSGFKGIVPNKRRWSAQIKANNIQHHLGTFDTPEQAHAAYCHAAELLHGKFARTR